MHKPLKKIWNQVKKIQLQTNLCKKTIIYIIYGNSLDIRKAFLTRLTYVQSLFWTHANLEPNI